MYDYLKFCFLLILFIQCNKKREVNDSSVQEAWLVSFDSEVI